MNNIFAVVREALLSNAREVLLSNAQVPKNPTRQARLHEDNCQQTTVH
jgi:hypothetical protein